VSQAIPISLYWRSTTSYGNQANTSKVAGKVITYLVSGKFKDVRLPIMKVLKGFPSFARL
jgi:hypothetical protein